MHPSSSPSPPHSPTLFPVVLLQIAYILNYPYVYQCIYSSLLLASHSLLVESSQSTALTSSFSKDLFSITFLGPHSPNKIPYSTSFFMSGLTRCGQLFFSTTLNALLYLSSLRLFLVRRRSFYWETCCQSVCHSLTFKKNLSLLLRPNFGVLRFNKIFLDVYFYLSFSGLLCFLSLRAQNFHQFWKTLGYLVLWRLPCS